MVFRARRSKSLIGRSVSEPFVLVGNGHDGDVRGSRKRRGGEE